MVRTKSVGIYVFFGGVEIRYRHLVSRRWMENETAKESEGVGIQSPTFTRSRPSSSHLDPDAGEKGKAVSKHSRGTVEGRNEGIYNDGNIPLMTGAVQIVIVYQILLNQNFTPAIKAMFIVILFDPPCILQIVCSKYSSVTILPSFLGIAYSPSILADEER